MPEGFPPPVRRVEFTHPPSGEASVGWLSLRLVLCGWTSRGCAYIERDGYPLDVATLATLESGALLGGATLVVMHAHLHAVLPESPAVWVGE